MRVEQGNLFKQQKRILAPRQEQLVMDAAALTRWKERIYQSQQQVSVTAPPQQETLFALGSSYGSPDQIDPFSLRQHSSEFYRLPHPPDCMDEAAAGCLYFIIDKTLPILLYCGETKLTAQKRWQGTHDCKSYISRYVELHRRYRQDVAIVSAFWIHLPSQKKLLREWETALIHRWRSPFNKQNWKYWGQPFQSGSR